MLTVYKQANRIACMHAARQHRHHVGHAPKPVLDAAAQAASRKADGALDHRSEVAIDRDEHVPPRVELRVAGGQRVEAVAELLVGDPHDQPDGEREKVAVHQPPRARVLALPRDRATYRSPARPQAPDRPGKQVSRTSVTRAG